MPRYADKVLTLNSERRRAFLLGELLVLTVIAATACGPSSGAPNGHVTYPRCTEGRPQSEIDAAGPLPLEPQSARIACVQVAGGTDRSYRLTDGRPLHLYEHVGPLPAKPSRSPTETGSVSIGARSWSWRTLDAYLVLSTDTPEKVYVELGLPTSGSRSADLDLLKEIAATLKSSTR